MAETLSRPADAALYEEDFALWAERQGALLRAHRFEELDLDNLIEEVEDLSRRERESVESFAETIMEHLLRLAYSPATRPRRGWLVTVAKQRAKLQRKLTTTLRSHLQSELPNIYGVNRRAFAAALAQDKVAVDVLPATCPYTLEQILDPDWHPENLHGLQGPMP